MGRLAIFSLKRTSGQLVLVLSDPAFAAAGTVMAAPLFDPETFPVAAGVNPLIPVNDQVLVLAAEQMSAISVRELGAQVATCEAQEYAVANAINRLFFGI